MGRRRKKRHDKRVAEDHRIEIQQVRALKRGEDNRVAEVEAQLADERAWREGLRERAQIGREDLFSGAKAISDQWESFSALATRVLAQCHYAMRQVEDACRKGPDSEHSEALRSIVAESQGHQREAARLEMELEAAEVTIKRLRSELAHARASDGAPPRWARRLVQRSAGLDPMKVEFSEVVMDAWGRLVRWVTDHEGKALTFGDRDKDEATEGSGPEDATAPDPAPLSAGPEHPTPEAA